MGDPLASIAQVDVADLQESPESRPETAVVCGRFEKFLEACATRSVEQKILDKLSKYFLKMDSSFRESDNCSYLLEGLTEQVANVPQDTLYTFLINEVLGNFKCQQNVKLTTSKRAHIAKLEQLIEALAKKIRELQASSVDWDDENEMDSAFLQEERYAKKLLKAQKLLNTLKCEKDWEREATAKFVFDGTRYPEINRNLSKYINKYRDDEEKVPPDYPTVLDLVQQTASAKSLKLSPTDIESVAVEAFKSIIHELKRLRLQRYHENFGCYLTDMVSPEDDPAKKDEELRSILEQNQKLGTARMNEKLEEFVIKQENPATRPTTTAGEGEPVEEEDDVPDELEEEVEEEESNHDDSNENSTLDVDAELVNLEEEEKGQEDLAGPSARNGESIVDKDQSPEHEVIIIEDSTETLQVKPSNGIQPISANAMTIETDRCPTPKATKRRPSLSLAPEVPNKKRAEITDESHDIIYLD